MEQDNIREQGTEDTEDSVPTDGGEIAEPVCCCPDKTKERDGKEKRDLINRLSRIEGQVRGVKKMVEEDAYCVNILTQVAAANAALNSFTRVLLTEHIKTCVMDDILAGKEDTVDELILLLKKLMK